MARKEDVGGLAHLLSGLFNAEELRRFLFDAAALEAELPGPRASTASLAFEAARALTRHGRIDAELFGHLRAARPGRTEDIDRVAGERIRPDGQFLVPYYPVLGFCGRDALVSTIRAALTPTGHVILAGPPGVGKTQLSLAIAGAERDRPLVAWLPASDPDQFFAALGGLAVRLGWRAAPPLPAGYPALLDQFAGLDGALLLLDGANDPVVMAPLVAQLRACAVVVTSTSVTGWGRGMVVQRVAGLEVDAACGYLLKTVGSEDRDAATALSLAVEGLPLALAQMAAYCIETGRTLSSYADLLDSEGVELIDHPGGTPEYPAALSTVVRLALKRLEGRDADALAVLRTMAHLGPHAFPRSVLEADVEGLDPLGATAFQGRRLDLAIAAAQRLGFLEMEPGHLRMHGLFQKLVTHLAGPTEAERYRGVALRKAGDALRSAVKDLERIRPSAVDGQSWLPANERCVALFPAALWVSLHIQPGDLRDDLVFEVTWHVARKLAGSGRFATAVLVWKAMLAAAETDPGPDAPHALAIREALGVSLQKAGDIPGAYGVFLDLMERRERVGGSDIDVADARHQLGFVLMELGRLAEAQPHLEAAHSVRQRELGDSHPRTAAARHSLGLLATYADPGASKEHFVAALVARRSTMSPSDPEFLLNLANLVAACLQSGDIDRAEEAAREAVANASEVRQGGHPYYASVLLADARVRGARGDLGEARTRAEAAWAWLVETRNEKAAIASEVAFECAECAMAVGDAEAAIVAWRRVLDLTAERGERAQIAPELGLGKALVMIGAKEGLTHARRALARWSALVPKNEQKYSSSLLEVAGWAFELQAWPDAEALYREILDRTARSPIDAYHAAVWTNDLAVVLLQQGKIDAAIPLLERVIAMLQADAPTGERPPVLPEALGYLAYARGQLGEPGEAIRLFRRAVDEACAESPGAPSQREAIARLNLAKFLEEVGDLDAPDEGRTAYGLLAATFPEDHPLVHDARRWAPHGP